MLEFDTAKTPLVFDLDGTLHDDDLSWLDYRRALLQRPMTTLLLGLKAVSVRARLKCQIAECSDIDISGLRYDQRAVDYARQARAQGRYLVLATGTAQILADRVAQHLGCFDLVLGTTPDRNFVAREKAVELVARFGRHGFDYVGNSSADLQVWPSTRHAVVVNAASSVERRARQVSDVIHVIPRQKRT